MARPKTHLSTAELDAQIAELRAARDAEVSALLDRRREAERAEHGRRGELLVSYLTGAHGPAIRTALMAAVAPRDRPLFGLNGKE